VIVQIIRITDMVNWKTTRVFLSLIIHLDPVGFFPFKTRPGANREIYIAGSNPVSNDPDTKRNRNSTITIK
jgi:hypothetical protein